MKDLFQKLQQAWKRRKPFIKEKKIEAFRLIHEEADALPDLSIEIFGEALHCILKSEPEKNFKKLLCESILEISKTDFDFPKIKFWSAYTHTSKTQRELKPLFLETPHIFSIREFEFLYEIHLNEGLHTGLFLDQRDNRERLYHQASGKRVLNLFCYTGSFSVAALKGGAREVVSVDLSKKTLRWLERNLILNQLDLHRSKTYAKDVFDFLEVAQKKNEKFDIIILDPPTFSRGSRVFSTEKQLSELVLKTSSLLEDSGEMLISINTQKWTTQDFYHQVQQSLAFSPRSIERLHPSFDFESKTKSFWKGCWVRR
ncbi:MAG: class I SAM-dependent rRNA methyltransferase [Deltaproteobacteria bacterium]|nr:class I SAM-dependent rRNA methyltransferase [Deltaproteobacteria bacterium]